MRICHGLLGEAVEVQERELQRQRLLEIVRHRAQERWDVEPDDLIVLAGGGTVLGSSSTAEELGAGRDVFFFLRGMLDPQAGGQGAGLSAEELSRAVLRAAEGREAEAGAGEAEAEEVRLEGAEDEASLAVEDALRAIGAAAGDPVFESFRDNVTKARRYLAEARPAAAVAGRLEARLDIQRLAVQAVLDNLTSHRATCSRSLELFMQKHERVQERLEQNLAKVDEAMEALRQVPLHVAVRTAGRETLADAVPRDRILRFTSQLQAERGRLGQQLEKLKSLDMQAQSLCDQAATKVQQLLQDESVECCARGIQEARARALTELMPALGVRISLVGTEPVAVLEEERRCAAVLEGLSDTCRDMLRQLDNLRDCWERRGGNFLQRLREVSYTQSKVRSVERQAALLEEEVNVQYKSSQQLDHLTKMPRAYQKALSEVARRREFKARYISQGEQARSALARMMEDENRARRGFVQRYGCHLPTDLVRGLGSLVPAASVEVPDFDAQLPDLGQASQSSQDAAAASTSDARQRRRTSSSSAAASASAAAAAPAAGARGALPAAVVASSASSCSSSLRADPATSSTRSAAGGAVGPAIAASGSNSGSIERSGSSGGSRAQVAFSGQSVDTASAAVAASASLEESIEEAPESLEEARRRALALEAQNRALERRVEALLAELQTSRGAAQPEASAVRGEEPAGGDGDGEA